MSFSFALRSSMVILSLCLYRTRLTMYAMDIWLSVNISCPLYQRGYIFRVPLTEKVYHKIVSLSIWLYVIRTPYQVKGCDIVRACVYVRVCVCANGLAAYRCASPSDKVSVIVSEFVLVADGAIDNRKCSPPSPRAKALRCRPPRGTPSVSEREMWGSGFGYIMIAKKDGSDPVSSWLLLLVSLRKELHID